MEKKEYVWIRYIKNRIKNNKNFIFSITGPTGSGKTWAGLSIGELLDPEFGIDRVVFKAKDLMALINSGKLKSGSVILWDEAGIDLSSRSWQSMMNKMINFLLQTFRHKNFILIFTMPYADFIDAASRKLLHAEFETASIDRAKGVCNVKPKLLQYNSSNKKWYRKYLKNIIKGAGSIRITRWSVPKPSPGLIEVYEDAKTLFTNQLNAEIEDKLQVFGEDGEIEWPLRQKEIKDRVEKYGWPGSQQKLADDLGPPHTQATVCRCLKAMKKKGWVPPEENEKKSENSNNDNNETICIPAPTT